MVQPTALADNFAVSPQLMEADFAELAAAGYQTIINNRPDGEDPAHLTAAQAQALAHSHGLNYVHVPVSMSALNTSVIEQFSAALADNPGPVLAHCKSGTRSCVLWTITMAQENPADLDALMQHAAQQGYDIARLRPLIEQHVKA